MIDFIEINSIINSIFEIYNSNNLLNNQKFLDIYKSLSQFYKKLQYEETRFFSSFLTSILFLNDKYNIPNSLRQNLNEIIKFNKQLKKNHNIVVTNDDLRFLIKNSYQIIYTICQYDENKEIKQFINNIPNLVLQSKIDIKKDIIDIYNCIVVDNPFYKKNIDAKYIELNCYNEEIGDFFLKIGFPYLNKANMIYKGMNFNLISAEIIRNEPFTVSIRSNGLFVFEPDILIDVTDLAENFGNIEAYRIYFVKKYFSTNTSIPILKGKIINTFFDELILNPSISFEEAKEIAYNENSLAIFSMSKNNRNDLIKLRDELVFNFENLQNIIDNKILEEYSDAEFTVEPSFISPKYGIQGRIDLLAEYPNNESKKDIIELKSGKAPKIETTLKVSEKITVKIGVWINHLIQVLCYNLLLDSTYENRIGNSSILYIQSPDNPIRNIATFHNLNQQIILLRNNIILLENSIMNRSFKFFEYLNTLIDIELPYFVSDKISHFIKIYNKSNNLEQAYLTEFTSFTLRERYASKNGFNLNNFQNGFSALWQSSIEEKITDNSILFNLKLNWNNSDLSQLYLSFDFENENIYTSFRKGDIIILYSYKKLEEINVSKNQILRGVIKEISTKKIKISLRNKLISKKIFDEKLVWAIEQDKIDSTERNIFSSLLNFISAPKLLKELIFGIAEPHITENYICDIKNFNDNQREVVQNAVNSDNYYLIDGPPGTGKTHKILKHIIEILLQNYNFNILVAAYTNRAVDEITEAIQSIDSNINFIRIGSKEASDDFEHHLPKIIEKYGNNEAYKRLKQTKVIISTVSSLHTNAEIFDLKDFDTLIIDEASQILETYLIGLIIKVRKFILIGDDKQLPPISIQNPNSLICDNPELMSIGINNFSNSLFSRLKQICENNNWNNAIGKLSYQARMHNEIQEFPNLHFYENRLIPKKENQFSKIERFDTQAENKIEKILAKNRVIFIECPLDVGKTNKYESEICKSIVETIEQKYELNFELLGIISPFRMQCFELLKNLNEKQKEYINIDTVERYQGSQREFIIMSCSANSEFLLERIKSEDLSSKVDRKLNVAITRAKSHFIMLGNSYYLSKSTHYNNFINYVKSKNSFYYFEDII